MKKLMKFIVSKSPNLFFWIFSATYRPGMLTTDFTYGASSLDSQYVYILDRIAAANIFWEIVTWSKIQDHQDKSKIQQVAFTVPKGKVPRVRSKFLWGSWGRGWCGGNSATVKDT